jgi:dTDP-4-dehydrorhamnose reductase
LSSAEIDKKALITRPFASKIREIANLAQELKESNPRLVIFVDDKYCSAIDLAKAIIRDAKQPNQIEEEQIDITTDDYLKLSFLFDGNLSDPKIKANKEQYIRLHKELVH